MKILVIDDHPLIQEALKHVLTELDASLELIQAHDASSAHAALSRTSGIDLLVLDLTLPGCDGFDLLANAFLGEYGFGKLKHLPRSRTSRSAFSSGTTVD